MAMETSGHRTTPQGLKPYRPTWRFVPAIRTVLRATGMLGRGLRNGLVLETTEVDMPCPGLPPGLDGYTILHLSDFHFDGAPELVEIVCEKLAALDGDLAVLTGDYQTVMLGTPETTAALMAPIVRRLRVRDGIVGILGNHDSHRMLDLLEGMGVTMLLNETIGIGRGDTRLHLTGTDDVHLFYTDEARKALRDAPTGFRIALVHTPDLATEAAGAGCNVYLCGHTHGGQICLPGRRPVLTALDSHRRLASGPWRLDGMQGYTSRGIGGGNLTVRFNCPGEIARIRLRAA